MDRSDDSDEVVAQSTRPTGVASASMERKRTTSVLEKLRLRTKSTIEKDSMYSESDFGSVAHGEILGLLISLRIPYTQTGSGKNGAMKVLYVIRCTLAPPENAPAHTPMKTWEVTRRFSEFVKLDRAIKDRLKSTTVSQKNHRCLGK